MTRRRARNLSAGWVWYRMEDVVDIETTVVMPEAGATYTYVGLEHIESGTGAFVGVADVDGHEIQSNKFRFGAGHVLYGKLRPYLNKVALPEFEGICSTDILPLRPKRSVLRQYIAFWLRSARFLDYANTNATGTKMPRLGPTQFRAAPIPVPPLPVQERIVEILQRADEVLRKRRDASTLSRAVVPSVFNDMFGSLVENHPCLKIGSITTLVTSGHTPRGGARNYIAEGPLLIRSQNVRMLSLDLTDCACIPEHIHEEMSRVCVMPGDVLLNITGASIGRVAWVDEDIPPANVNQHVCIIRTDQSKVLPEYLAYTLATPFYQHIILNAPGSAQSGFNHARVRALEVLVPPIPAQRSFVKRVQALRQVRDKHESAQEEMEATFSALLQQAFAGGLTAAWEETRREAITTEQVLHARLPQLVLLGFLREHARRAAGAAAASLWLTGLMKYAFLLQMEGAAKARLYHFVSYHYGPFARDVYTDLEALREQGLIAVEPHGEENPAYGADNGGLLRVAEAIAPYGSTKPRKVETPRMDITIADTKAVDRTLQDLPVDLREDIGAILDGYGDLTHNALLKAVYEKYPAFAKKSKLRGTTNRRKRGRGTAQQQQHAADGASRRR